MLGSVRFILLLIIIPLGIVTIDQFSKRGRFRILWLSGTITAIVIFFLAGAMGHTLMHLEHGIVSGGATPAGQESQVQQPGEGSDPNAQGNSDPDSSGGIPQKNRQNYDQNHNQTNNTAEKSDQSSQNPLLLLPVDEADQNPDFAKFRDSLMAAVARKDLAFLKEHTAQDIRYSFGTNNGINGFMSLWKLDTKPTDSEIWPELSRLLLLGGTFDKNKTIFTAPYVFSKFPCSVDAFRYVAVIKPNINIYAQPDANSRVIIGLSYNILKLADSQNYKSAGPEPVEWKKVFTPDGQDGFIDKNYVRSPVDYRAQFKKENGTWKMILFVSGD